jgi:two-component system sensor histidine kinase CreC
VLFDSDAGRDVGADYSQWRDVYLTLNGRYGARSSEFDPLFTGGSTMYIASPIRSHGALVGVVAVGKPTRNAERFMGHALENLRVVALLVVIATVLIGLVLHGWLSRPLRRLHDYAIAIRDGERQSLPKLGNNEVGQVGQAMDEMRQALDGKTYVNEYVQALTHELKSPLAAVRGAAELLEEEMPPAERQRFLRYVLDQTGRMQDLIDRLLELAALENRPAIEERDRIRLAPLLRDVRDSLQPIAASRQVSIRLAVEGDPTVSGEPFLLHKAVSNLLKNAVEFSPAGGEVEVTARTSARRVVVQVADQGPGIPDYARDKVYNRFYSLRRPDGRKGSGLGLSFVREIAALHKADLSLQQGGGAGTIARLSLPSGSVR